MGHYLYVRNKKTKANQPGWWPESKKIEAVTAVMQTGSPTLAAAIVNVPLPTIRTWRKQPWWKEMEQQIHDEDNVELDSKISKIIKKTLVAIEDRLDNGNYTFDQKTGRIVRVPVNMRDSHAVMSDLIKQRRLIRNEPTEIESKETVNDRLVKLAEQFATMAMGAKRTDEMKMVGEVYENNLEGENAVEALESISNTQDDTSPTQ